MRKTIYRTMLLLFSGAGPALGQAKGQAADTAFIITKADRMPALPGGGGLDSIRALLYQRMVFSPGFVNSSSGVTEVTFVVSTKGQIVSPRATWPVCPPCDAALLAAVKKLPRLRPAESFDGRPVAVRCKLRLTVDNGDIKKPPGKRQPLRWRPQDGVFWFYEVEDQPKFPGGEWALKA